MQNYINQDYINLLVLLLTYAIVVWILIGISVLIVNYLSTRASKIENANRMQQTTEEQNEYQKMA